MSESEVKTNEISKRTTPTWEMELLISGATVFSLLQLPAPLYRFLSSAGEMHGEAVYLAIKISSIYIQFSLWILIITFVLHLFMRGYWIAMVGMNSVFPKGIQWEKMTGYGPIHRKSLQKNSQDMSELIEVADNRATIVFGLGFGSALTMLSLSLLMGLLIGILLTMQVLGINLKSGDIISAILLVLFGPYLVVYTLDNYFGEKLLNGKIATMFEKVIGFYDFVGIGQSSVLINLYRTNKSRRISYLIMGFMAAMGAASSLLISMNGLDGGAYNALPSSGRNNGLEAPIEYYASLRQQTSSPTLHPYIEGPVSDGPYLRLFVPYIPRYYNEILQEKCPQASSKKSANMGAGLQCVSTLLKISIDGKPVAVELMASGDPQTGQRGMLAMIPIHTLPSGKHELSLVSLGKSQNEDKPELPNIIRIPFWK